MRIKEIFFILFITFCVNQVLTRSTHVSDEKNLEKSATELATGDDIEQTNELTRSKRDADDDEDESDDDENDDDDEEDDDGEESDDNELNDGNKKNKKKKKKTKKHEPSPDVDNPKGDKKKFERGDKKKPSKKCKKCKPCKPARYEPCILRGGSAGLVPRPKPKPKPRPSAAPKPVVTRPSPPKIPSGTSNICNVCQPKPVSFVPLPAQSPVQPQRPHIKVDVEVNDEDDESDEHEENEQAPDSDEDQDDIYINIVTTGGDRGGVGKPKMKFCDQLTDGALNDESDESDDEGDESDDEDDVSDEEDNDEESNDDDDDDE